MKNQIIKRTDANPRMEIIGRSLAKSTPVARTVSLAAFLRFPRKRKREKDRAGGPSRHVCKYNAVQRNSNGRVAYRGVCIFSAHAWHVVWRSIERLEQGRRRDGEFGSGVEYGIR